MFDVHIFIFTNEITLTDFDDFQRNYQRNWNHSIVKKKIGGESIQGITEVRLGDVQILMLSLIIVDRPPKVGQKGSDEAQKELN